jgi:hypothetical protein
MTTWWHKFPSLTPVKGFARFLYVVTHWETISDDLRRRDERVQAVDDTARLLLKLQKEAHEAEFKAFIEQALGMAKKALDEAEQREKNVAEFEQRARAMFDDYADTAQALALMLYIEQNAGVRDMIMDRIPPKARDLLALCTGRIREVLEAPENEIEPKGGGR